MAAMKQRLIAPYLTIPLGPIRLRFGVLWLALLPLTTWGLRDFVLPIAAPGVVGDAALLAAIGATLTLLASLMAHCAAHGVAALLVGAPLPEQIPVEPFGDAAQVWPAATTPGRDALVGLAGPIASGAVASLCALIWNLQVSPAINAVAFLATMANAVLAILNLLPGYPIDGGRVLRSVVWADFRRPAHAVRAPILLGLIWAAGLATWGGFLLLLNARFSLETGGGTLAAALALLAGQRHAAWRWGVLPETPPRGRLSWLIGAIAPTLQLGVALLMLPLVDGLYAPGPAVSVIPMVIVPDDRRTETTGQLMLTTVVAQTPITLGQWAYARIEPAFTLVPPEQVVPRDTTPQQVMRRNVQMLEESEATAVVVGVRLAGFTADLTSTGLAITAVAPESPSIGKLVAGDTILAVDGVATPRLDVLRAELAQHTAGEQVVVALDRQGASTSVPVTLMAPGEPGGPPRIGVTIEPVGLDVVLPFPVKIEARRIAGGPSAGLMFTLAVFDLLSPEDLTGGWTIAGTGTIALDGTVGPIGGAPQKIAGAEWAGADYILVPREHADEARRVARTIQVIPVSTVQEAIDALRALPKKTALRP